MSRRRSGSGGSRRRRARAARRRGRRAGGVGGALSRHLRLGSVPRPLPRDLRELALADPVHLVSPSLRDGTVLVDTGVGPAGLWGWDAEFEEACFPHWRARRGAEDVDVVFLTHLHVDHVGWNTDREAFASFRTRATSRIATGSRSPGTAAASTSTDDPLCRVRGDRRRDRCRRGRHGLSAAGALSRPHGSPDRPRGERAVLIADAAVESDVARRARRLRLGRR